MFASAPVHAHKCSLSLSLSLSISHPLSPLHSHTHTHTHTHLHGSPCTKVEFVGLLYQCRGQQGQCLCVCVNVCAPKAYTITHTPAFQSLTALAASVLIPLSEPGAVLVPWPWSWPWLVRSLPPAPPSLATRANYSRAKKPNPTLVTPSEVSQPLTHTRARARMHTRKNKTKHG